MILGILSDTHGHWQRTAAAVRLLQQAGASAFVHCGDIGGPAVLDQLAGLRSWLVCGNVDYADSELARHAAERKLDLAQATPLWLDLDGRRIAVFHGHEQAFAALLNHRSVDEALRAEAAACDYILHGHTHIAADTRLGELRLINPGAVHEAVRCSVATLDLARDRVEFWRISDNIRAAPDAPGESDAAAGE